MLKFETEIEKRGEKFFNKETNEEVFPFPPKGARVANSGDFVYRDYQNNRLFKLGVEFWALMSDGYFHKFQTTPLTNKTTLSDDLKLKPKRIYIVNSENETLISKNESLNHFAESLI